MDALGPEARRISNKAQSHGKLNSYARLGGAGCNSSTRPQYTQKSDRKNTKLEPGGIELSLCATIVINTFFLCFGTCLPLNPITPA